MLVLDSVMWEMSDLGKDKYYNNPCFTELPG